MAILLVSVLKRKISKMRKIDVSQWKEFKISHILTKVNTAKLKYRTRDLPKKPNSIYELPASTSSVINQGLSVYVPKDKATVLSNCLLVLANGDAGTVFYEPKSFTILQDSYALNLTNDYISHNSMNVYLYLASILTKLFHRHFGWNNKAVWTRAKNLMVKLPVDKNGDPDWHYMDEYIAKLATQAHTNISLLRQQQKKAPTVNIDRWKEFKITDFYQPIVVPNKIHKIDMYDDLTIPVFSAGGFQGFVDHADFKPQTHYLLFGDQTCTFFYIDYPFSVMDNVKVLKPLADISLNQSLFIQTVAMRVLGNIGYSRYWSILKKKVFQLPVDKNGDPDWQYMDAYIAKLATQAHTNISLLRQLLI